MFQENDVGNDAENVDPQNNAASEIDVHLPKALLDKDKKRYTRKGQPVMSLQVELSSMAPESTGTATSGALEGGVSIFVQSLARLNFTKSILVSFASTSSKMSGSSQMRPTSSTVATPSSSNVPRRFAPSLQRLQKA